MSAPTKAERIVTAVNSMEAAVKILVDLPSNRAREMALARMLQKGLQAEVRDIARALGMRNVPDLFSMNHLISLARLIEKNGGRDE